MVGREREQSWLHKLLDAALAGCGSVVLIGGEAGIGKTTLVDACVRAAADHGTLVLTGHCYDLTATPPYGPWFELAGRYTPVGDLPALPDILTRRPGVDELGSQDVFFEHIRAFVAELAASQPLVLVLEDLHWSDPASLELLRYLARAIAELRLLLVVTYRVDELTRRHPLFQLLPLLVREAQAERLDLRSLSKDDTRELVAGRYALPVDDEERLNSYLVRYAEGNPLFITELLRTLEEQGILVSAESVWALGDLANVPVPPLVRQAIESRLFRLDAEARDLLAIAAILGHVIALDTWSGVSGADEDRLLDVTERAVEAGFLVATRDGTAVRFTHALVREALYESMLPPRRRARHRQAGEVLAGSPRPDPDAVSYHFKQAGDERAIAWLIRAGDRAQRTYAWPIAVMRFDEAIHLLEGNEERAAERGWLLYRVGKLLRFTDNARGIAYLEEATRAAGENNDQLLAAYALFDQGMLRCVALDIRRGLAEMEAGIAALQGISTENVERVPPNVAAWVADALGRVEDRPAAPAAVGVTAFDVDIRFGTYLLWLAWTGHVRHAQQLGEPYVARATSQASPDGFGDACNALGSVYAALGRPQAAREMFAQARKMYQSIAHHILDGVAASHELRDVVLVYDADRIDERRRLGDELETAWARAVEGGGIVIPPRVPLLPLLLLDGRWDEAHQLIRAVPEHLRIEKRHLMGAAGGVLARNRGDAELAWTWVRESLPEGPAGVPGNVFFIGHAPVLQRLAIELSLDSGDLETARAWLESHERWLAWSETVVGHAEGQLLWSRYHRVAGDLPRAYECAETALELAGNPRQPLALLVAHRALGELGVEAQRYAEADQHLQASLALADACAAPYERALTLLALARLRVAEGKHAEARNPAEEARAICASLGALPALAQADALLTRLSARPTAVAYPAGLTAREVEVLRLVAQGLTDAEVAEQLYLARRTINTHLTSIYTKLGVSSRAAATRFAVEQGLT
jgi:DNA-binding CsgD family transcriptional regulator